LVVLLALELQIKVTTGVQEAAIVLGMAVAAAAALVQQEPMEAVRMVETEVAVLLHQSQVQV
jgi:hypothetical protein